MTTNTVKLLSELLGRLGYPPLKFYKEDDKILVRLDTVVFNNLYTVSLMFLLFKYPVAANRKHVKSFSDFLLTHGGYNGAKTIKFIGNWDKLFPKPLTWKELYGSGAHLHGEGSGELLGCKTRIKELNLRAAAVSKDQS